MQCDVVRVRGGVHVVVLGSLAIAGGCLAFLLVGRPARDEIMPATPPSTSAANSQSILPRVTTVQDGSATADRTPVAAPLVHTEVVVPTTCRPELAELSTEFIPATQASAKVIREAAQLAKSLDLPFDREPKLLPLTAWRAIEDLHKEFESKVSALQPLWTKALEEILEARFERGEAERFDNPDAVADESARNALKKAIAKAKKTHSRNEIAMSRSSGQSVWIFRVQVDQDLTLRGLRRTHDDAAREYVIATSVLTSRGVPDTHNPLSGGRR